jgi:UDP-2-acetamido-3-amino-2,3-dideoxy-glucuronate N-acetyltransferase
MECIDRSLRQQKIEDEVFSGASMVFTNVCNPRAAIPRIEEIRQTLVRKGASIRANSTIVCGATVGSHSLVGAASLVRSDVADNALVVGSPENK